jgi:hypothetical protein
MHTYMKYIHTHASCIIWYIQNACTVTMTVTVTVTVTLTILYDNKMICWNSLLVSDASSDDFLKRKMHGRCDTHWHSL